MSILEDFKSVVSTIQKIDNIELYRRIIDLHGEVAQLVADNVALKNKIKDLEQQLETTKSMRFEYNGYWAGDSLETSDGPFCSKCWDADKKQVRLQVTSDSKLWSRCPVCNVSHRIPRRENNFDKSPEGPAVKVSMPERIRIPSF
jgi:hypothetical protein